MKLGIDFGTTNTAISHMDGDVPRPLVFGDAQQPKDYIPSVVALKPQRLRGGEKAYFGDEAKNEIGQSRATIYQNFKMLLGEDSATVEKHWRASVKLTPGQVTEMFVKNLIENVKQEHRLSPTGLVVTVPEVWIRQNLQSKREQLINAFRKQGVPGVKIESEPVAAASYFLYCFKKYKRHPFAGHVLVCDCGGGTLDFCLAKVEYPLGDRPQITVLERAGNGFVDSHLGKAGVAFDQEVVNNLFPSLRSRDPEDFYAKVREFESLKISHTKTVSEQLRDELEYSGSTDDDRIFKFDGVEVKASLLISVFNRLIHPEIKTAIQEIKERMRTHAIDDSRSQNFRVLMVGGFSSFYLIQNAIGKSFGKVTGADERFEEVLSPKERALAIANGAALIANDLAEVVHTCPANIGIIAATPSVNNEWKEVLLPILRKSTKISEYSSPAWWPNPITVGGVGAGVPVYLEIIPGHRVPINVAGQSLSNLLPPGVTSGGVVYVGFSVSEDLVFSIHVKDARNESNLRSTTFGNVLEQLPTGLVVGASEGGSQ